MVQRLEKKHLTKIGLLQASALVLYCTLVGTVLLNGNTWFGPMNTTPLLGPVLFLTLFVVSALICAMIALAYPFSLFWDKKNTADAISVVAYTAAWLALFVIIILTILFVFK